jgi:hypothetical protein
MLKYIHSMYVLDQLRKFILRFKSKVLRQIVEINPPFLVGFTELIQNIERIFQSRLEFAIEHLQLQPNNVLYLLGD